MIGLHKNEVKIFKKLTLNPQSVADVVCKTKMPRMTVYTTLLRLKEKKLVQVTKSDSQKRLLWSKKNETDIEKELSCVAENLLGKRLISRQEIIVYVGKEEVSNVLMELTVRKDGARMYSMQSSKNWKMWLSLMGKEWVNKHNRAVVKHKLIAFTIHSPEAPKDIREDKEITSAYKGRLGNSHSIPEQFLAKGLSLYIFEDTILLIDLEKVEAILFTDNTMSRFLIGMFSFIFEKSDREEFFQKFNREL